MKEKNELKDKVFGVIGVVIIIAIIFITLSLFNRGDKKAGGVVSQINDVIEAQEKKNAIKQDKTKYGEQENTTMTGTAVRKDIETICKNIHNDDKNKVAITIATNDRKVTIDSLETIAVGSEWNQSSKIDNVKKAYNFIDNSKKYTKSFTMLRKNIIEIKYSITT